MKPNRLEAFSDGVIAIIITIMVLDLKVPIDPSGRALLRLWPIFLSYLLSFVLVAIYWVNHHHLIHLVHKVDGAILWFNANLLFWMSLMPFATAYMGQNRAAPLTVAIYGGVQLACGGAFYLLQLAIAKQNAQDGHLAALHRGLGHKNAIAVLIYVATIPAAFFFVPLALGLMLLPAMMYFLPDRRVAEDVNRHTQVK